MAAAEVRSVKVLDRGGTLVGEAVPALVVQMAATAQPPGL
jgi:hypothetical protein